MPLTLKLQENLERELRKRVFLMNKLFFPLIFSLLAIFSVEAKTYTFIGQEYPPFNWDEKGKVVGIAPEIIKKVCDKLVIECKCEIVPVKRALAMMAEGSTDGFMSLMQ